MSKTTLTIDTNPMTYTVTTTRDNGMTYTAAPLSIRTEQGRISGQWELIAPDGKPAYMRVGHDAEFDAHMRTARQVWENYMSAERAKTAPSSARRRAYALLQSEGYDDGRATLDSDDDVAFAGRG